jgi:hypothetical protein
MDGLDTVPDIDNGPQDTRRSSQPSEEHLKGRTNIEAWITFKLYIDPGCPMSIDALEDNLKNVLGEKTFTDDEAFWNEVLHDLTGDKRGDHLKLTLLKYLEKGVSVA